MFILDIILSITKIIITALYQYLWISLIVAFLISTCYLFVYEKNEQGQGIRKTIELWFLTFRSSAAFRILFFLCFYVAMILFRTVLNRSLWHNPLNDLFGGWWIYRTDSNGELVLTTECLENIVLFIPFSFLSLWFLVKKQRCVKIGGLVLKNIRLAQYLTLIIEFSQLFLRVGTFQISDIVYNALGGITGTLLFLMCYGIYHKIKKREVF